MKRYLVGGAVRDALLGLPVTDRDWVLVGAEPEALLRAGYLPVGQDFPVFLHPVTKEECALARTERKTAPGYRGFSFHADASVTLEQDLLRRDLTINAMAQDDDGRVIDPYGGQRDLAARVLRHVSPAFAEDPVRILRTARFAARFADFSVAPETLALMQQMVAAGEVDALVPERVWQELSRGLMEAQPSRMFELLRQCHALARLLPGVDPGTRALRVIDFAAQQGAPLTVRYACLVRGAGADPGCGLTPADTRSLGERLRAPSDCRELADLVAREQSQVQRSTSFDAAALVQLLERCDAWRRPARFAELLRVCDTVCRCEHVREAAANAASRTPLCPQKDRLTLALATTLAVNSAQVTADAQARGLRGPDIGAALHAARVAALSSRLKQA